MTTEFGAQAVSNDVAPHPHERTQNAASTRVRIRYFAMLRDQAGLPEELWQTEDPSAAAVYEQVKQRYGFALQADHVRLAVNGKYCAWNTVLVEGDEVVFVPPVSGG